jgi:hypothetical protein
VSVIHDTDQDIGQSCPCEGIHAVALESALEELCRAPKSVTGSMPESSALLTSVTSALALLPPGSAPGTWPLDPDDRGSCGHGCEHGRVLAADQQWTVQQSGRRLQPPAKPAEGLHQPAAWPGAAR